MLNLDKINKSFGNRGESNFRMVLENLDFSMEKGESIAILGPSGSGKTSLLNIIGGLDFPDSGDIYFDNENIRSYTESDLDNFRNQKIGFVFQLHYLFPQLNLVENVLLPTLILKDKKEKQRKLQYAEDLLKRVGIWEHRSKIPGKMSGGECQRAALVRAMINKPDLLLADEPTGALDLGNAGKMSDLLLDLNKKDGLSLLLVTHSHELASKMQKVYILEEGKLILTKGK